MTFRPNEPHRQIAAAFAGALCLLLCSSVRVRRSSRRPRCLLQRCVRPRRRGWDRPARQQPVMYRKHQWRPRTPSPSHRSRRRLRAAIRDGPLSPRRRTAHLPDLFRRRKRRRLGDWRRQDRPDGILPAQLRPERLCEPQADRQSPALHRQGRRRALAGFPRDRHRRAVRRRWRWRQGRRDNTLDCGGGEECDGRQWGPRRKRQAVRRPPRPRPAVRSRGPSIQCRRSDPHAGESGSARPQRLRLSTDAASMRAAFRNPDGRGGFGWMFGGVDTKCSALGHGLVVDLDEFCRRTRQSPTSVTTRSASPIAAGHSRRSHNGICPRIRKANSSGNASGLKCGLHRCLSRRRGGVPGQ